MLDILAGLLLSIPALPAPCASPPRDDAPEIQQTLPKFELSREADGDRFDAVTIGQKGGDVAWRRARTSFVLAAAPQPGHWLLCVGGPDLALDATLNGHHLDPIADAYGDTTALKAGPRFDVAAEMLVAGENRLALVFKGERLGRGFEEGPALLLSPEPSAWLRTAATARELLPRVANLATLATASKNGTLLDRVAFRTAADGSHRLAAQFCFSVVGPDKQEIPVGALEDRKATAIFPTSSVALVDKRIERFNGRLSCYAPLVAANVAVSRAKAVLFDVAQIIHGDTAGFRWRVRIFPTRGGALHVFRGDGFVLLHNGVVGIAGEKAKVVGDDDAPLALELPLVYKPKPGEFQSMAGPSLNGVIVGFDGNGTDPSGAASLEELAGSLLHDAKTIFGSVTKLSSVMPMEPVEKAEIGGLAALASAVANLANFRERGERTVFVPPEGPASAAAFFEDEWTLFNAPVRERATVEWLLSTQGEEGAVRGDAPAGSPPLCELERDCYVVLRACRWFRWSYDGDALRPLVPKLQLALKRARALADGKSLEQDALAHPKGERRASLFHLHCALAAAHRALGEALVLLGNEEAEAKVCEQQADELIAALQKQFTANASTAADEDPREQAAALVFQLLDAPLAVELAKRLAELAPPAEASDWREALLARGLLDVGAIAAGRQRMRALETSLRATEVPVASGLAAYHTALVYGVFGLRRNDLGTLEFLPRLVGREQVRASIPLPEGPVRIQILSPANDFRRQLVALNDSTLDLMLIVGVPGGLGDGERRKVGDATFSLYQEIVPAGQAWRPMVR
jgi:hypothetical protein